MNQRLRDGRWIVWLVGLIASSHGQAATPRYNVLLIIADDLRCATGCYGDRQAKTPHIDRLAARSVQFERAYVQYPVCNPSRTSMLTSTRPELNGVAGNHVMFRDKLPSAVTLPQLFRQHGARCLSYGKIFHAGLVEGEIEDDMLDREWSWDEAKMFRPTPVGATGDRRNLTGGALPWCDVGSMNGSDSDQSDGQTTEHVVAAMQRHRDQRWFIGAGFHRPHDPFVVARRYAESFPPGSLRLFRDPEGITPMPRLAGPNGQFQQAFDKFTDDDRMAFLTHYYAGAAQTDAQLGQLLDVLDQLALWDETIVMFVGDHGYHLGERNWWNKNTLFERSCRAPCLMAVPGIKPGTCRSLIEFVDIYPTLAELCELPVPAQVTGQSFASVLQDPSRPHRDAAMTYVERGPNAHGFSLRTDRWRYTEWSDGEIELYDHDHDPEETVDVHASFPDVTRGLGQRLAEHRTVDNGAIRGGARRGGD